LQATPASVISESFWLGGEYVAAGGD